MNIVRMAAVAGGTMTCALGIGYLMQMGEQSPSATAAPATVAQLQPVDQADELQTSPDIEAIDIAGMNVSPVEVASIALTAAQLPSRVAPIGKQALPAAAFIEEPAVDTPFDPQTPRLGCDISASATVLTDAMMRIEIQAPCNAYEQLTLHHMGLMVTYMTSEAGHLDILLPALSSEAVVLYSFDSGPGAILRADVPDLSAFDRVAIQWRGAQGFQIHAREFGAAYGEAGHVWSGAVTLGQTAAGHVITLGDPHLEESHLAEIYTLPRAGSERSGEVALTVETEVTDRNCGRDIAAQSIELRGGDRLRTRDMVLSVPDCSTIGDFLVLNNLIEDLKIVAR